MQVSVLIIHCEFFTFSHSGVRVLLTLLYEVFLLLGLLKPFKSFLVMKKVKLAGACHESG